MAANALPTTEIGSVEGRPTTGGFYSTAYDADEMTAAMTYPNNLRVYAQMCREDSQIAGTMRAITLPIRRNRHWIDPQAARPEVVQLVAGDLGLPVAGMDPGQFPQPRSRSFSFPTHLQQALLCLRYGHMFFEQVYDVSTGVAHLAKLAPRMPRTITAIKVAADGGLVAIEQEGATRPIPVNRLVAYVHEMEGADWRGTSILRPAYKHWLIKDRLLRVQAQAIDRNGMGVPIYTGAEDKDGTDLAEGLRIASGIRSGDNAGVALPAGASLTMRGVEGTVPDAMNPINYHDQQIARAMLAHVLNLGTQSSSATGSYNLGSQFYDILSMSLQTIDDMVCDVITRHVIEDLVTVNYGPDEPAPRLIGDDIGSQHDATPQAILALMQAGAISPDRGLEQSLRLRFGLPLAPADQTTTNAPTPGSEDA